MKHELSLSTSTLLTQVRDRTGTTLPLVLHLIKAVSANGDVQLANCGGRPVLCPQKFTHDVVGSFAVCVEMDGTSTALLVLGHLPLEAMATALAGNSTTGPTGSQQIQPITLKCGRSQLQLHPDGRIRITGDDIIVESNGRAALRGAIVDLN